MREADLIERLRRLATHPGARELRDDAAVLEGLVLTHDTIAEGVHFFPFDPPASVGWKLLAVNLSDLAAKGAAPVGVLLSVTLSDDDWIAAFIDGMEAACESYRVPLLGGDTISLPPGAPRIVGLTAVGRAGERTPARSGGRPGDRLWVAGTLGDAAAGLALLDMDPAADGPLVDVFRRPVPLLEMGRALAPHATAMMDVSDGLLLDLSRLCAASGCGAEVQLDAMPLSRAFVGEKGQDRAARLFAASGGDDYALLAAIPPELDPSVTLSLPEKPTLVCIGRLAEGHGISLTDGGETVPLPERLGYEHRTELSPMDDRG
ncbi:thiamine-phosphate kinase [Sphingomonas sinipercae]|uniref:Thiamine-monophosphate kinase n=1 Tax=Sphingomonas sinipercae TaxID=2714944 RepID=A0A6G7ZLA0_9SPHN|nr:thiamine-phosphate kinase [Sphingomonas sinipercae]QIL01713.1 thiamine-phosphate kinase [Sphingomonas sinipercae]